jgi:tetratricopeptide (TPR) repeat protein
VLFRSPDLELQIEEISAQISLVPSNADLYLRRGDLYRRHQDWLNSARDFKKVRELEPDQAQIDWYEGRLEVDAGRWAECDRLLSRYLEGNENFSSAYHTRGWARWQLNRPEAAAHDYALAISNSERPAPALYRSLIITQFASGGDFLAQSAITVDAGLQRFPGEVSLLGLGVDLALADANADRAEGYMDTLSPGLSKLPQWTFRQAVLYCLRGNMEADVTGFESLIPDTGGQASQRSGSWTIPLDLIEQLALGANPQSCREAVLTLLRAQQP